MVNKVDERESASRWYLPIVAFVDTSESYSVRASNVSDDEIAKSIKDKFG